MPLQLLGRNRVGKDLCRRYRAAWLVSGVVQPDFALCIGGNSKRADAYVLHAGSLAAQQVVGRALGQPQGFSAQAGYQRGAKAQHDRYPAHDAIAVRCSIQRANSLCVGH